MIYYNIIKIIKLKFFIIYNNKNNLNYQIYLIVNESILRIIFIKLKNK